MQVTRSNYSANIPLCVRLLDELPQEAIGAAITECELVEAAYDPVSQMSNYTIFAGTSLTYDSTGSGILYLESDDTRQSDT